MRKLPPKAALVEALMITVIAAIIGLSVNAVHPRRVSISTQRPPIAAADDSVFAEELPGVVISGGNDPSPKLEETQNGPITVNTEQVRRLIAGGKAVVIDARNQAEFISGHIPEAINLPFERISAHTDLVNSLPHDKWLICYCDGPPCDLGELLAFELWSTGFETVAVYQEGMDAWRKSNAIEKGEEKIEHAKQNGRLDGLAAPLAGGSSVYFRGYWQNLESTSFCQ